MYICVNASKISTSALKLLAPVTIRINIWTSLWVIWMTSSPIYRRIWTPNSHLLTENAQNNKAWTRKFITSRNWFLVSFQTLLLNMRSIKIFSNMLIKCQTTYCRNLLSIDSRLNRIHPSINKCITGIQNQILNIAWRSISIYHRVTPSIYLDSLIATASWVFGPRVVPIP